MAFGQPSDAWPRIHRGHNSWRVIQKIPEATGESEDEIGFIDVVPFRTRMDKAPSSKDLQRAWGKVALPQIQALQLRRIVALGKKAWEVIARRNLPKASELIFCSSAASATVISAKSRRRFCLSRH